MGEGTILRKKNGDLPLEIWTNPIGDWKLAILKFDEKRKEKCVSIKW